MHVITIVHILHAILQYTTFNLLCSWYPGRSNWLGEKTRRHHWGKDSLSGVQAGVRVSLLQGVGQRGRSYGRGGRVG